MSSSGNMPYAVVIGAANIDILGRPQSPLIAGDSNPGKISCSAGGVGRNIADNLARLGTNTRLISVVGNDTYGQLILEQCQQAGIDTQYILQLAQAVTSTYLSVLNEESDLHIAINDMAVIERLTVESLMPHDELLKQAKLLIIDTNLPEATLAFLLTHYDSLPIFIDTVSATKANKIKPYLNKAHTLKPNLTEAQTLSGIKTNTPDELPKLANWFHDQGVQRIFLSLGANGVFYSDNSDQALLPAITTPIINTNGAGDAFMAGLAHAFMQDWSVNETSRFASAAASVALSGLATINPAMSEETIRHILKEHNVNSISRYQP